MNKISTIYAIIVSVFLFGCWGPYTHREEGAVTGAVLGAGAGAIVGAPGGHAGTGAAIGGASGAVAGAIVGDAQDVVEKKSAEQDATLRKQEKILKQQSEEIDDAKRQQFYDEEYRRYLERTKQ